MKKIGFLFFVFSFVAGIVCASDFDLFGGIESEGRTQYGPWLPDSSSLASPSAVNPRPGPVRATTVTAAKPADDSVVRIYMPDVEAQDDSWSCGINSGTRMLNHYGVEISYDEFRRIRRKSSGSDGGVRPSLLFTIASPVLALASTQRFRLGTQPKELVTLLNAQLSKHGKTERAAIKKDANLADIKSMLRRKKPVVALIEPAKHALHWIIIAGFNEQENVVYYYETNGANRHYQYGNDVFSKKWLDWDGHFDRLPLVGLKEGTFVYVD
jgi:hypothetical protein